MLKVKIFLVVSRCQLVNITISQYDCLHCINVLRDMDIYTDEVHIIIQQVRCFYYICSFNLLHIHGIHKTMVRFQR
jgi:prepilin signal peptidase PulO-like enzyme (type II secretory pathway)